MKLKYILVFSVFSLVGFCVFFLSGTQANLPSKKSLNIAWATEPHSYDPRYATDANSQYLEGLLHCSLITFDADGNITKDLAKSWEWISGTQLNMQIKPGVSFADGSAVTLMDVKKTYDFFIYKNKFRPSPRAVAFRNLKELKIKNKTLQFFLKKPDASFLSNLVIGILPDSLNTKGLITKETKVRGCGLFVHKKSTLNEIILERRKQKNKNHEAKVSLVKIKIVKDPTTRFAKLRKGELDIVQNGVSYQNISSIEQYQDLKVLKSPALRTSYLGFNFRHPLLRNVEVRKAIAHSINKKAIIQYILKGLASEAKSLLPERHQYSSLAEEAYEYNIARANEILDKAGLKSKGKEGVRFSLTLTLTNDPTRIAASKVLVSDLKKIGIQLKVRILEWGKFKQDVEKGLIDLWLLSWIGYKDPDIYRYAFATESFPPNGGNRGWYSNPDLDKLLNEGINVYDLNKRKEIYGKISSLVTADLPYIFLYHDNNYAVLRKNIKNFKIYADGRYSSLNNVEKL